MLVIVVVVVVVVAVVDVVVVVVVVLVVSTAFQLGVFPENDFLAFIFSNWPFEHHRQNGAVSAIERDLHNHCQTPKF